MPELESLRVSGVVIDATGRVLGEARVWGTGVRGPDGAWNGWLRSADLGGRPPLGRYTIAAAEGWTAEFDVTGSVSRVFETELVAIAGVGPPPWPPPSAGNERRAVRSPLIGTPWQGAQGIPPYKQEGDGRLIVRRPAAE